MRIIVCVEDNFGMLFNKRRVSSDRAVTQRISELAAGNKLWMNSYSSRLFEEMRISVCVDEDFLNKAEKGDYCFVENADIMPFEKKVEQIILFRWNRRYPSDLKLSAKVLENRKKVNSREFAGNSHEKITEEIYE